ncbi:MAG TPA: hypothetical protein VLA37_08000 [Sphingomonadaceae bacterium]|nr:hypothetical protein [Sphingomonadaceae bacterium]
MKLQIAYHEAKLKYIAWRQAKVRERVTDIESGLTKLMIECIGSSTVSWAVLEWRLDNLIDTLHDNGGAAVQSTLPVSLDGKLDYLKKAVKAVIIPASHHAAINQLRDDFQTLKTKRHDTVHGIVIYNRLQGSFIASRTWVKKGKRLSKQTPYTVQDVIKLSNDAAKLGTRVEAIHNLIRRDLGLEDFKYPGE